MPTNFLPLSRELQKHWIYKESDYLHVWIEMLFNARFSLEPKTDIWKGVIYTIEYGQFLYSVSTYSERLKISESRLKTLMNHLKEHGMIRLIKSLGKNKPTIYEICNYSLYNSSSSEGVETVVLERDMFRLDAESSSSDCRVDAESSPLKKKVNISKKANKEYYDVIFQHYLSLDLIKHKALTQSMKKAIDKAMKDNSYSVEDCIELLNKHNAKVNETKDNEKPIAKRPLDVFFGQKVYNAQHLICSEYEDGRKYGTIEKEKPKHWVPIREGF